MNTIVRDKILPFIPPTNYGGDAVTQNIQLNRATTYNLHKFESKVDYNATSALRFTFRYGKHPYYNYQDPIYGQILGGSGGFPQSGAGNYLQNGHNLNSSGTVTYVASPTLVLDTTVGRTNSHQILWPHLTDQRYALEVMGIPGTNQGPLPYAGSIPRFSISGFASMGMSYSPLEYKEPLMDYMGNVTKIQGAHTIRAGGTQFLVERKRNRAAGRRFAELVQCSCRFRIGSAEQHIDCSSDNSALGVGSHENLCAVRA